MFPTAAATSEGSSVSGHERNESHPYEGVRKVTDKSFYIAEVRENDETKSEEIIHLGKFDNEVNAARAHDLVALKLGGSGVKTNFPESQYKAVLETMTDMSKTEVVDSVRMLSFSFMKSISMFRGVSRDFSTGKWQAYLDKGNDDRIFLGLFDTEEEAARAYDFASIRLKGLSAITNFSIRFYDVDAILLGQTDDEKMVYESKVTVPVEDTQHFEVFQNITGQGSSTMVYGSNEGNLNRVGEEEVEMPLMSGNTEEQANSVALASLEGNSSTTNVPLQRESDTTRNVDRSGGQRSTARERFNAYKKFIKRPRPS
ncbi:AP2-like ethylene-responsive transcription factor BBM [Phaseolus vulgaris]